MLLYSITHAVDEIIPPDPETGCIFSNIDVHHVEICYSGVDYTGLTQSNWASEMSPRLGKYTQGQVTGGLF